MTGQYDYEKGDLAAAIRIDLNKHHLSNLTFARNEHTSLEIVFNEPMAEEGHTPLANNLAFVENRGVGLLTRTSFLAVHQLRAENNWLRPSVEFDPFFGVRLLDELRTLAQESWRGVEVRRELTRLHNHIWHIGELGFGAGRKGVSQSVMSSWQALLI